MPEPAKSSDSSQAYLKVESGSGSFSMRIADASARGCHGRVHVAWIILPFLLLLALQAVSFYWLLGRSQSKPHITVVIDLNGTQNCPKGSTINDRPCKKGNLYVSSKAPIGPLRCHDDAFEQSSLERDNCRGNRFRIAQNGLGIVIPKDGLYRLYAKVSYYDPTAHQTSVHVRIDPPHETECLGNHACLAEREAAAHAWLICQQHQPAASSTGGRDFTGCAVDGIRRFTAGQTVGLQVAIGHREIVGHRKATYMYIHQL